VPLPFDLNSVDLGHVEKLLGQEEGYRLEFKATLNFDDKAKHDLCADVTSFANEDGGDILIGVSEVTEGENERTGRAECLVGIERSDIDALERRVIDVLSRGTDPRVTVRVHSVPLDDKLAILVIRVAKSPNSPHAVKNQDNLRFYGRHRKQKEILDVRQIRERFLRSDSIEEQIVDLVTRRLDFIGSTSPVRLRSNQFASLFVIPQSTLLREAVIDPKAVLAQPGDFCITTSDVAHVRLSPDGCLLPYNVNAGKVPGYVLVHRTGLIEFVSNDFIRTESYGAPGETGQRPAPTLNVSYTVESMLKFAVRISKTLHGLGFDSPLYLVAAMQDMQGGFLMEAIQQSRMRLPIPFDRARLVSPIVTFESLPTSPIDAGKAIRPIVEYLMNCGGLTADGFYNLESGDWLRQL
jgi:hypothetical protein